MVSKLVQGPAEPVYLVDAEGNTIGSLNGIPVDDVWTITLTADNAAGNSKVFTVPNDQVWQIMGIYVEYVATGTVGDRQLVAEWRNGADDVIGAVVTGIVQAASAAYRYSLWPSLADLTAIRDSDFLMTPLPPTVFLQPGFDLIVYDNNAVDANDTVRVRLSYAYKNI